MGMGMGTAVPLRPHKQLSDSCLWGRSAWDGDDLETSRGDRGGDGDQGSGDGRRWA